MIENQKKLKSVQDLIHKINDVYRVNPDHLKKMIVDEISTLSYFENNKALYGIEKIDDERDCVWALNNQGAAKTVILFNQYSTLAECANEVIIEGDWVKAEDWMIGLALHLDQMHRASTLYGGVNLLFISVPIIDYGHAKIMKPVVKLLSDLKVNHHLNYEVVLLSEGQTWQSKEQFSIGTGFAGRMMPIIATKGMSTHVDTAYKGLNAISIANEVVKAIELNTEMSDAFNKRMTPPPNFIDFYNVKPKHKLSTPEYTIATFNWHFLKDDLNRKMCQLKELCAWSVEDAINQFNYSYNEYLRKQALPSYRECMHFDFEVAFVQEKSSHVESTAKTTETPENHLIRVMEAYRGDQPIVLIGMLDTYLPVVSSALYFETLLLTPFTEVLSKADLMLEITPYHISASGINLLMRSDTKHDAVIQNLLVKDHPLVDVLNESALLDLEILHIGPRFIKESNQLYRLDIEDTIPTLIETLMKSIVNH